MPGDAGLSQRGEPAAGAHLRESADAAGRRPPLLGVSADTLPVPPDGLGVVTPAPELEAWAWAELIEGAGDGSGGGLLHNEDHRVLADWEARIGWLWMPDALHRKGRRIAGTAQLGRLSGDAWKRAEREAQLVDWFGQVPDFIIRIDAGLHAHLVRTGRRLDAVAVLDHELYHCRQERDQWNAERFHRDGSPVWGMRAHDVEQFVGVVRRYGSEAAGVTALVEAAGKTPEIGPAVLDAACGCGAVFPGA